MFIYSNIKQDLLNKIWFGNESPGRFFLNTTVLVLYLSCNIYTYCYLYVFFFKLDHCTCYKKSGYKLNVKEQLYPTLMIIILKKSTSFKNNNMKYNMDRNSKGADLNVKMKLFCKIINTSFSITHH